MIKVIIAENEPIMRNGLKEILEQDKDILVRGLAADGKEAYGMCMQEQPNLILMDIKLPHSGGTTLIKKIKKDFPHISVLIFTIYDDQNSISSALSSGADGYILKNIDGKQVVNSIKSTVSGVSPLSFSIFEKLRTNACSLDSPIELTANETKLLSLIAHGNDNKQIAKLMFLSEGTARNYTSQLLKKLHLKSRTQLAAYAAKYGLN